jgi:hypothetical protein
LFVANGNAKYFSTPNTAHMRKVLRQDQNNGKALEVRLELEGNTTWYVILAGMTIYVKSGTIRGVCDSTGPDEYLLIENETYRCQCYTEYGPAHRAYDACKAQYID